MWTTIALLLALGLPRALGAQGIDLASGGTALPDGAPRYSRAVIDSLVSPGTAPMGLDWVGEAGTLYHVDEALGAVYAIRSDSLVDSLFSVASQIGVPSAGGNGICCVTNAGESFLYVTDYNGADWQTLVDMVYQFSLDGTLAASYTVDGFADGVLGISFDGSNFWLSADEERAVIKCDSVFREVARYDHPGLSGGGIDFDPLTGRYYLTDVATGVIYVCDSSMVVVDAFPSPSGGTVGLAVGRTLRGRSLWTASWITDLVYEIDDEYLSPVERTTWSAIKAMFR